MYTLGGESWAVHSLHQRQAERTQAGSGSSGGGEAAYDALLFDMINCENCAADVDALCRWLFPLLYVLTQLWALGPPAYTYFTSRTVYKPYLQSKYLA